MNTLHPLSNRKAVAKAMVTLSLVLTGLLSTNLSQASSECAQSYLSGETEIYGWMHPFYVGNPVHSFYPRNDVLFSLDEEGRLFLNRYLPYGKWMGRMHIQSDVISASVSEDSLYFVQKNGILWRQQIAVESSSTPVKISLGEVEFISANVASVSAGSDHYLFVKNDHTLMGGGKNQFDGRLGFAGGKPLYETPIKIAEGVAVASAGNASSMYVLNDGSLWGMGANYSSVLGLGHSDYVLTPTKITDGIKEVLMERDAACLINVNSELFFTGKNHAAVTFVASKVKQSAITLREKVIVYLTNDLQLISATISDNGISNYHLLGTQIKSVASKNVGFIYVEKGIPLVRFMVPENLTANDKPFDKIAAYARYMVASPHQIEEAYETLTWNSINHRVLAQNENGAKPVYRFLNKRNYTHVYTLSDAEISALTDNPMFEKEGVAYYAFNDGSMEGVKPVYRFFMTKTASHYYTINEAEKIELEDSVANPGFVYEGVAYFAYPF